MADDRAPYPGLRPFEADEADLFFGREQHVDALLKRLSNSHFVAVVGESGAGKSSLVRAGLLPALQAGFVVEAGSDWRVAVMRPGGSPMAALADALLEPGVLTDAGGSPRPEFALAELRRGPLGLVQLIRDAYLGSYCNLLVVVDQFEEVFRYCREPAQKDQADMFVELILRAAEQREVPIFIVLTMRSDFVGDCARFRGLPERLNDNQYLTPRLTREQIAAAIREPARVCGGVVDAALVDELCNAIGDNPDQLPLLQHLLMRVWDRASERAKPPRLTGDLVTVLGGLYSALNHHAQQVYESLRDDQKVVARAMFKRLTDPLSMRRDLRRDALVSDIAAVAAANPADVIAVADVFRAPGRHMLMPQPATPLDAQSRLDISHESLIRQWVTLNEWAREESASAREFQRLRDVAREELKGQADLMTGRDLSRALDWRRQAEPTPAWAARYSDPGELESTLAFIARSAEESERRKDEQLRLAEREAKAKREHFYSLMSVGSALLAVVVAGVIYTFWRTAEAEKATAVEQRFIADAQRLRADDAAEVAKENAGEASKQKDLAVHESVEATAAKEEAHARLLAADARVEVQNDPGLAILLAGAAVGELESDEQALDALRVALAGHVPNIEPLFSVAKSRHYVSGTKQQWLDFSLNEASVSPREPIAVVPSGKRAIVWSLGLAQSTLQLPEHGGIVGAARFSPDGKLVATSGQDGNGRVWDASTGKLIKELKGNGNEGMLNDVVFSPDGKLLITLADNHIGRIWNVGEYSKRCDLTVARGNFLTASFSRDGAWLVTVIHDMVKDGVPSWNAKVWNIGGGNCPKQPEQTFDSITDVKWASFSPYGPWLGIVQEDGEVVMVNTSDWLGTSRITAAVTRTPSDDEELERKDEEGNLQDYPPPIAWSADGQYFAAAGKDHVVRVAKMDGSSSTRSLRGHTGRVTSLSFAPSGNVLLSTSNDGTARLWRLDGQRQPIEVLVLRGHEDGVGSGVFASGGSIVVTAGDDGRVRVWRPQWTVFEKLIADAASAGFTPDAKRVWVRVNGENTGDGSLSGWTGEFDASTMTELNRSSSLPGQFVGNYLVDKATDGELRVRTARGTGSTTLARSSDLDIDDDLVISSDARFILASEHSREATSGAARVWDLASPGKPPEAIAERAGCRITAISSDKRIAWYCAGADRIVIGRAGQATVTVSIADRTTATAMQFSRSGRWLAVNFRDRSVRLFDGITGEHRRVLRGHDEPIVRFSFSDDEGLLLGIGEVRSRIWGLPNGERIAVLPLAIRGTTIKSAAFSPNARSLAFVAPDRVLVWQCEACGGREAMLAEVKRRQGDRPLQPAEASRFGLGEHNHTDAHVPPGPPTKPVAVSTTGTRPR